MADTFRAMCAELVRRWDAANGDHDLLDVADAMDRTRTLLAQPEPEGLTEIALQMLGTIEGMGLVIPEITDTIRKALEQGHPTPQPPADGEVGELVEALKGIAYWRRHGTIGGPPPAPFDIRQADRLDRAADLLERLASPCYVLDADTGAIASLEAAGPGRFEALPVLVPAAQPVAVSERLPGSDDCDEQGRCWVFDDQLGLPSWTLIRVQGEILALDMYWLPANALPLPQAHGN